jgi:hypothetical protein
MSLNLGFHKLAPGIDVRRWHHDGTDDVPEFWSATLTVADSSGHRQSISFYSTVGPLVFHDPDAPALEVDPDDADVEPVPASVASLEAHLLGRRPVSFDLTDHTEVPALESPDHLDLSATVSRINELGDTLAKQRANRMHRSRWDASKGRWMTQAEIMAELADEIHGWDEAGEVEHP